MKGLVFKKGKIVQDLSYFKKDEVRKIAREQFEKLQRLGLFPRVVTRYKLDSWE